MSGVSLVQQVPGIVPVYTTDGTLFENPAVGYAHSMLSTICSETDAGYLGISCMYAHGDINSNVTVLDVE